MGGILTWLWGNPIREWQLPQETSGNEECFTFELDDDSVKVSEAHAASSSSSSPPPKVIHLASALDRVSTTPHIPNSMTQSICSVAELHKPLKAQVTIIDDYAPPPQVITPILKGDSPYDRAFFQSVKKSHDSWNATYSFTNASELGTRGDMDEELMIWDQVPCTQQVFKDAPRWGKAQIKIGSQVFPMDSGGEKIRIFGLLSRIFTALKKDKVRFHTLTRYLNQGPFNDMIGMIQREIGQSSERTYLPDQKSLFRSFDLQFKQKQKKQSIVQFTLIMKGLFLHSADVLSGTGIKSGTLDAPLGSFYGITTINLSANTGTVRLGATFH